MSRLLQEKERENTLDLVSIQVVSSNVRVLTLPLKTLWWFYVCSLLH